MLLGKKEEGGREGDDPLSRRVRTDDTITDYLFTSQQLDASIGLYWYGSRAYDPELGRFGAPIP